MIKVSHICFLRGRKYNLAGERTTNSIRNLSFTIGAYGFNFLLQLMNRVLFVRFLSQEYLGLCGLFSNIMLMLAIVDLGLGEAMVYKLYKPIAEKDEKRIIALMQLSTKLFRFIGGAVFLVAVSLTPFLQNIIKDMPDIPWVRAYYLLFVIETVIPYFFCTKRFLIYCDQKVFITMVSNMAKKILTAILQILVLYFTRNFFLFLVIQVVFTVAENFTINRIADRIFPFIRHAAKEPLPQEEILEIKKTVYAATFHKVGNTVLNSSDNIIISSLLGLNAVGIIFNYQLVVTTIQTFIVNIFTSISASVGNLTALKDEGIDQEFVFNRILLANYFLSMVLTSILFIVLNPFISLMYGEQYLLSTFALATLLGSFYLLLVRKTVMTFRDVTGLFWNDRYKSVIECVLNIAISIPLTLKFGIAGTFLGTIISILCVSFWVEPFIFFKHFFRKSMKKYILKQIFQIFLTIGNIMICVAACSFITSNSILHILGKASISGLISIVIFSIVSGRSREFAYFYEKILASVKLLGKKINFIGKK